MNTNARHRVFQHVNSTQQNIPLPPGAGNTPFGTMAAEVEIVDCNDLRNLYGTRSYIVTCRQRIAIPGCGVNLGSAAMTQTPDYPVAVMHELKPAFPKGASVTLLEYFPKTINASIASNNSVNSSSGRSSTQQYSSGSSVAQTNSYDVSASLGFMGEMATGSISAGYSHSDTTETSQSTSRGRSHSFDAQSGSSTSMSIRDWGGYASLDSLRTKPTWYWVQEYPWNVANFNTTPNTTVRLPEHMQDLLGNIPGNTGKSPAFVFPPGPLATYGIDFVSVVRWRVDMPAAAAAAQDETISFKHVITYYTANHQLTGNNNGIDISINPSTQVSVVVNSVPGTSSGSAGGLESISMSLLGLNPITPREPAARALVGFVPGQFIYPPDVAAGAFRIISETNNIYVTGTGFQQESDSNSASGATNPNMVLSTRSDLSSSKPSKIVIYFKILEKLPDLALYLKHWRTAEKGVTINITINKSPTILRHVDAIEAGDGSSNITVIQLCNRDLNSADYFDYLQLGLNCIKLSIVPSSDYSTGSCGYALRALAVL